MDRRGDTEDRVRQRAKDRRRSGGRAVVLGMVAVVALLATACDWTMYMGGPALNGVAKGQTSITPANVGTLTEAFRVAAGDSSAWVTTPTTSNGRVYAVAVDPSSTPDGPMAGHLVAAADDGTTGCSGTPVVCQPLWTADLGSWTETFSQPLVYQGTVYVTALSTNTYPPTGALEAFDADGVKNCSGVPVVCQPLWTASVASWNGPNAANGNLYVTDFVKGLEVFDAAGVKGCSGTPTVCQPLWSSSPVTTLSTPSIAGGKVYVTDLNNGVDVFDAAGVKNCSGAPAVCQPLFSVLNRTNAEAFGSVDVSGGTGYFVAAPEIGGGEELEAFDATGATGCSGVPVVCQTLWTASVAGDTRSTPTVSAGRAYLATTAGDGVIWAFDAAGQQGCSGTPVTCTPLAYYESPAPANWVYAPATASANVLFLGGTAFDATGSQGCTATPIVCQPLWTVPSASSSGAAVAYDTVYVGGTDGYVHAYKLPSS
jgi:hypothetical protein